MACGLTMPVDRPWSPPRDDDHQVEDRDDRDLGGQQHRQHPAGQFDVAVAEVRRHRERRGRERPPRHRRAAEQLDDAGAGRPEQAVDARLDRQIADDRDERDADADREAQRLADIGEERACLLDVRRHRGEADREEQQDDRRDDEGGREAGAVAVGDAERHHAADDTERRGRGDHHEDDGRHAEVAAQSPRLPGAAGRWCHQTISGQGCFRHLGRPSVRGMAMLSAQ